MDERILRKREKRKKREQKQILNFFKTLIFIFLIVLVIFILINRYIASIISVEGDSMQKTLYEGDKLLVKKIGINEENLEVDDLIYFKGIDDRYYVKRIIAKPGDVVEIVNDKVFVNGVQKLEDYINGEQTLVYDNNRWFLEDKQYFVLGDNRVRDLSKDSRLFGPIKIEQIEGKIIHKFGKER